MLAARKLHRKAERVARGLTLVEGPRALDAAVRAGASVVEIFVSGDGHQPLIARAEAAGAAVVQVDDRVLGAVADTVTPSGVVAVVALPPFDLDAIRSDATLVVVLADVADPGNAGTLIRSAVAAGADAVVCTGTSVDPFGPKAIRSAAGYTFTVPVVAGVSLAEAIHRIKRSGLSVVGTDAGAADSLYDVDLRGPVAVVVGNEARGLDDDAAPLLDRSVRIDMPGGPESLNAAVAGSLVLFEVVRQRRAPRL